MFDPFDILGLEKSYSLDTSFLEKKYFEIQKKIHPDRVFIVMGDEKDEALKNSTLVNQAYLLLKDPLRRAEFLLRDAGVELLSHDPEFLGVVMEWNERLQVDEDIKPDLEIQQEALFKLLERAFVSKDYDDARRALYRLTYIQKMMKDI